MNKIFKSLMFFLLTLTAGMTPSYAGEHDKLETAKTQYIDANGIKFSYRTIGNASGTPLVMLIHFTGTMDYWDPAVVNGLAKNRKVIVFNNRGIGKTNGVASDNIADMTTDAYAFIQALGYKKVDILGFSMGGYIAQELAAEHPELVNKVILAGTSNHGGGEALLKVLGEAFSKKDITDVRQYLFFSQSEKGQLAAKEFIKRAAVRVNDRDPESGKEIADAQAKAIITWANTDDANKLLKSINQPVLIVQGSDDTMLLTKNSYTMFKEIKNAQLILYPDANHASLFEYHDAFVNAANYFLSH
ncbi:MAG: alpha/beta fold hydrolase [Methylophilaceae bacterium]